MRGRLQITWIDYQPTSPDRSDPDFPLVFATLALVLLGLVMVASASVPLSYGIFERPEHLLVRQAIAAAGGLALLTLLVRLDYRRLHAYDGLLLLAALGLTLLTLIPALAPEGLWLKAGSFSFQPTELVKLALIVYLAASLAKKEARGQLQDFTTGVLPAFLLLGALSLIALAQPDYALVVIYGAIVGFMLLVAGVRIVHLLGPAVAGLALFFGVILGSPYHRERLLTFLDPLSDPQGAGYHLIQSLIALGSGGIFGRGLGAGREKWLYLPSAYNDFILSVLGEELGLVGVALVIGLFALLGVRGFRVAARAPDRFGFLLAAGLTFALLFQATINLAVAVGALPVTGLTLPFVSYGGSSLIVSLAMVGILLSISRHAVETGTEGDGNALEGSRRRRRDGRTPLSRAGRNRGASPPLRRRGSDRLRRHGARVGGAYHGRPSWSGVL